MVKVLQDVKNSYNYFGDRIEASFPTFFYLKAGWLKLFIVWQTIFKFWELAPVVDKIFPHL